MTQAPKFTNALVHAHSPYLLQHAHNPVNWMEWGEEAWSKAAREDKLVLVSIGYSSCHWCHVMERETFEDEDSAAVMNEYFVCIKVDREERPDIDQVYMDAVQLINSHGGWPLNMFCLPDGRPLHGGTYFPTQNWNQLLFQLHDLYENKRGEALDYAQKLTEGVAGMDLLKSEDSPLPDSAALAVCVENWAKQFDWTHGGNARTPKFPLPVNFSFLLSASRYLPESDAGKMVELTLDKIALGGIYDHLQGGFARYSTDAFWKVPHFEKMLYDNAQLVSLYAKAWITYGKPLYAERAAQCIAFMEEEWLTDEGLCYSSFDADSEGEEGTYYVWTAAQIEAHNNPDFIKYYGILPEGNWEHGKNILHATMPEKDFALLAGLDPARFSKELEETRRSLLALRQKREKPGLDTKCILSWNALLLEGLCDAARFISPEKYTEKALSLAVAIETHFKKGTEYHRLSKGNIPAFLEDMSALCSAYIALYQICFDEQWLLKAREIANAIMVHFYDKDTGFFFFVSERSERLIVRKKDLHDDVIPSANAQLASCFLKLYHYFLEPEWKQRSERMMTGISDAFQKFTPWYSHWGEAFLYTEYGTYQVCLTGKNSRDLMAASALARESHLLLAAGEDSDLPILAHRKGATLRYFVCRNETCHHPVSSEDEALRLLQE